MLHLGLFSINRQPIGERVDPSAPVALTGRALHPFEPTLNTPLTFVGRVRYFVSVVGQTPDFTEMWKWDLISVAQNGSPTGFGERTLSLGADSEPIGTQYCDPLWPIAPGKSSRLLRGAR
jgi:hypothetical protein